MKVFGRIAVLALAVMALVSCDFISSLLGPGPNDIVAWVSNMEEGTKYSMEYRYRDTDPGYDDITNRWTVEVVGIEERATRTIVRLFADGGSLYLIADDSRGELLMSEDDVSSNDDGVLLKVPVEEGNSWLGNAVFLSFEAMYADVRATIRTMEGTREVGTTTATDVIEIGVDLSDYFGSAYRSATMYFSYTYGWLGERIEFGDGTYVWSHEIVVTDLDLP